MPQLELEVRKTEAAKAPHTCLFLRGFVDPSTLTLFESKLKDLEYSDTRDLIVDCAGLRYISSGGMGIIMALYTEFVSRGRELVLASLTPEVHHLIEMIGVSSVVPLFTNADAAMDYLQSGPPGKRLHPDYGPRPKRARGKKRERPDFSPRVDSSVLIVSPWKNRFNDVMRRRLSSSVARFEILETCRNALDVLDTFDPDLVILEDKADDSEGFVFTVKTKKKRSVIPLIRIFGKGDESKLRGPFKIWENDYLIEPFDMTELFTISEWQLKQSPARKRGVLHQTHFTFDSSRESVDKANQLGKSIIDQLDLDAIAASGIKAAFAEAVDNAIRHGSRGRKNRHVDVRFLATKEKLTIRIEDQGAGFDFEFYLERIAKGPEAYKRELRKTGRRGGLGILVMALCTDELRYEGKGNVLQMVKMF